MKAGRHIVLISSDHEHDPLFYQIDGRYKSEVKIIINLKMEKQSTKSSIGSLLMWSHMQLHILNTHDINLADHYIQSINKL